MSAANQEIPEEVKIAFDTLILETKDPDVIAGIKWIDEQAQKKGTDAYTQVFKVLAEYLAKQKAKEWLKDKQNSHNR